MARVTSNPKPDGGSVGALRNKATEPPEGSTAPVLIRILHVRDQKKLRAP